MKYIHSRRKIYIQNEIHVTKMIYQTHKFLEKMPTSK